MNDLSAGLGLLTLLGAALPAAAQDAQAISSSSYLSPDNVPVLAVGLLLLFGIILVIATFLHDDAFERDRTLIPTPVSKFVVLTVVSGGLYGSFWVWRNWRQVQGVSTLGAFFLTLFLPVTFFWFFKAVGRETGRRVFAGLAAILAILFLAAQFVSEPANQLGAPPLTALAVQTASPLLLIPAVGVVRNENAENTKALRYHARWSRRTLAGLAVGVLILGARIAYRASL